MGRQVFMANGNFRAKKFDTAVRSFCKKYPELEERWGLSSEFLCMYSRNVMYCIICVADEDGNTDTDHTHDFRIAKTDNGWNLSVVDHYWG